MRLTFQVRYHSRFGQSLWLTGNHEMLGGGNPDKAVPLQYLNDQLWHTTLVVPDGAAPDADITYNYVLREPDGTTIQDWGADRKFNPAMIREPEVLFVDAWNNPGFYENAFYTKAFKNVLLKANHTEFQVPSPARITHTFKIKAPLLAQGETLCLLGDVPALGRWNTAKPPLLNRRAGADFLVAELDLSGESFPLAYKYGVYDLRRNTFVRYEDGPNRSLADSVIHNKRTIVNDGFVNLPANTWKGAGVAIPVFSLRSERSFGVGEFTDLKLLADWCRRGGLKLIQILPINDTTASYTWLDSYPYSAISAFALHPMYLNLSGIAAEENQKLLAEMEPERKRLNQLDAMDYESVVKAKFAFLRRIYPLQKEATFKIAEYERFFEENQHWLVPYAVFCHLRDRYGTADFNQWPAHRRCTPETIAEVTRSADASSASPGVGTIAELVSDDEHAEEASALQPVAFHYFIQYHLHRQLSEATQYAHNQGVVLKGDLPIGVYRYGADAWQQPELYHLEVQAGAPPDAFAVKGQNWSFPTYNWPRMKADSFAWWKQRFEEMARYFDAFRIDHILGFFRIWSIPTHAVEGILGYFVPALPVHINEFSLRGIWFDRNRYTQPYITDAVLQEVFGAERDLVKQRFLYAGGLGNYTLRPKFATQRQVEHHFAALEDNDQNRRLKEGLFDLISNVILFEAEGSHGQAYHFRFAIESTSSFRHLDARTQASLGDLYIDYFFRRQDDFWRKEALQKLPALKRVTDMLACGEDLGLVPRCVPEVMRDLGLLTLEVQRMPKAMGQEFFRPKDAPYLSVVTPSTHDMSTIRGWWEEDTVRTQRFYNYELGEPGTAPATCEAWINRAIVLQHLASPAMWSIFQLQDWLGMDEGLRRKNPEDERINVPANPKNYWHYRMHLSLETLLRAEVFNDDVKRCVQQHAR
jgi:4-alpha-glucanotransferase